MIVIANNMPSLGHFSAKEKVWYIRVLAVVMIVASIVRPNGDCAIAEVEAAALLKR
jgi:hypothetical protein